MRSVKLSTNLTTILTHSRATLIIDFCIKSIISSAISSDIISIDNKHYVSRLPSRIPHGEVRLQRFARQEQLARVRGLEVNGQSLHQQVEQQLRELWWQGRDRR